MTLVVKDRIKETSSTTGTGTLTLGGAIAGFRTFADVGDGNTTYYCIKDGNNFEVGIGTYTHSGTTLSRDTVLQTSAGNTTKINCTGSQEVFVTQPADKAVFEDASGKVGLGTPNPSQNLHISSSDHTRALITGGTNKYAELQFENDAQKFAMGVQDDDKFFLYNSTGTSTVLTVDTSNRIGVGVTSPAYKFHQHENSSSENYHLFTNSTTGSSSSDGFRIGIDSNENALVWHREANSIQFATSNDQKMEIDSSGRVTVSEVGTDTTLSGGQPGFQVTGSGFDGYMAAVRRDSSAYSSGIILAKSRNTTADNFTIVQDNDTLGSILFIGDDGTDLDTYGAYITAEVNGTPAANNMPTDLVFATNAGAATATERLRIGSSGQVAIDTDTFYVDAANDRVGIGSTNPHAIFDVKPATDGRILFVNNSGDPDIVAVNNANSAYANLKLEGATLQFRIAGGYKGQFDTSGNLMVGRSSLGISNTGHTLAAAGYVEFTRDGAAALNVGRNSSFGDTAVFWKDGVEQGRIASENGYLRIEGGNGSSAGSGLLLTNSVIAPRSASGASTNGTIDLGYNTERFKDLYLGGTCNVGNDIYASSDIFIKGNSGSFTTTYDSSSYGTPLTISSATGYVGATFEATGSSANTWQLYFTGTGSSKFTGMYDRSGGYYVNQFYKDGRVDLGNGRLSISTGGSATASGDFRAPIFYDTDNTGKYINPNGTSKINVLEIDGGTSNAGNDATLYVSATNNNDWGIWLDKYRSSATEYGMRLDVGSSASYAFYLRGNDSEVFRIAGNGTTYIQNNLYASAFYDVDNSSYYLNPSSTSNLYRVIVPNYVQTPIVYDHNNSSYYVDPSSTSNLYNLTVSNQLYLNTGTTLSSAGSTGTSGQVLTSNGNSRPTWQDAGGGAWEVIGNYTGTNVNSVDFINGTNGFVWNNSTYKKITMYGNMVGTSSDNMMIQCFPLVSSGSSGNVVPNTLVFYVLEWIESFPEFSVSLSSSQKYYYQSSNNNNNNGVMWYMQAGATPSSNGGVGSFGQTIGSTYFGSNKRRLDTTIIFEVDALGLGTNKTFSWRARTNQDYPSFYFYPRQFDGETLSYGWTNQGLRIKSTSTSQNFNYDFTFIGLKP